jgi:hypothetical protein
VRGVFERLDEGGVFFLLLGGGIDARGPCGQVPQVASGQIIDPTKDVFDVAEETIATVRNQVLRT